MQHLKDLLEVKREELPQYEIDACINQFRHRLRKVIEVAGKHILNNSSRIDVLGEKCDCRFIMTCSSHLLSLLNHKENAICIKYCTIN